jgi:hypothetical protein
MRPTLESHQSESGPTVDQSVVLDAIVALHAKRPNIEFTDLEDLEVKKVQQLFHEWTNSIREIVDDPQKKLLEYLKQNMLMFDAGLITNNEGLKSLEEDLNDMLAETRTNEDHFMEYETAIDEYKKKIGDILKRADR